MTAVRRSWMSPTASPRGMTTPATISLQQKVVASVIFGLKRIEQLEENLKAASVKLAGDDLAALNEASAVAPKYPGWMAASGEGPRRNLMDTGMMPSRA